MNKDESELLRLLKDALVEGAPNKKRASTNALRKSIKIVGTNVTIGGGVVDYAPYTEKKWISPRWNGKQNPNEGWAEMIALQTIRIFASRMGYKVVVK